VVSRSKEVFYYRIDIAGDLQSWNHTGLQITWQSPCEIQSFALRPPLLVVLLSLHQQAA
jgi:hypothetical protein